MQQFSMSESPRTGMRRIADAVLPGFGFTRHGSVFGRTVGAIEVEVDLVRSRWDPIYFLNVGVFYPLPIGVVDDASRRGAEDGHISMRPVDFEEDVGALRRSLDWTEDVPPAERIRLFAEGIERGVVPAIAKLTDVDFLRAPAGQEYLRRMPVSLVAREALGLPLPD